MNFKSTLAGLFAICTSFASNAAIIEVSQGGNILGEINAFSGTNTAVQNWTRNRDPKIGPEGIVQTSQFFFYSNPIDGITFNILLDDNAGQTGRFAMTALVNTDGNAVALYGDDNFNEFNETSTNDLFEGDWRWANCCTDGGIIGKLSGPSGKWSIDVDISSFTNINQFLVQGPDSTFGFDPNNTLTFTYVNTPATVSLFIIGLMLASVRRFNIR